ncbi:MAG: stage II sporulation protein P [Firmicutes bacterium]|nr:stage II sporulation protein P [Bacillota bacterium]
MANRWRVPWVIWRVRRPARPRLRWPRRTRWGRPPRRPWRIPPMAWAYLASLGVAAAVFWAGRKPEATAVPVTAPLGVPAPRLSWLDRILDFAARNPSAAQSWLEQGILGMGQRPTPLAWQALVTQAAETLVGVRLSNLTAVLAMELPGLQPAAPSPAPSPPPASPPAPAGQRDQVMPGLPGLGGKVWAQLGARPVVGIYQTHSRESFWPELPPHSPTPYTTEWDKTIVQVGWWLAQDLYQAGVGVVQSRVDNMADGVLASYNLSYYTAKRLVRWYPTVRVLIDLHRGQASGSETTAVIHGQKVAKILIVVGTNKLLPNPYWHENYQFALALARALEQVAPGIVRGQGIETVPYRYNQQLMANDLLIEVGGPDNSLAEERYAVHDLAEAIAAVVHQMGLTAPPTPAR